MSKHHARPARAQSDLRCAIASALAGNTSGPAPLRSTLSTRLLVSTLIGGLALTSAVSAAPPPYPLLAAGHAPRMSEGVGPGMLAQVSRASMSKTLPERPASGITLRLQQDVFDPRLRAANIPADLAITAPRGAQDFYVVQFGGPIAKSWRADLQRAGMRVVDYVPDFAYLVKASPSAVQALSQAGHVRWTGLYQPAFRLSNDLLAALPHASADRNIDLTLRLFAGEPLSVLGAFTGTRQMRVLSSNPDSGAGITLKVNVPETLVRDLAMVPGVSWIEPTRERALANSVARSNVAMRKDYVEDALGLFGQDQVVVVGDTGFSTGNAATVHLDVRGRVLGGTTAPGSTCGGWADGHSHGTHVVGSVLGSGMLSGSDPDNHVYTGSHAGVAPEATLYMWGFCNDFSGLPDGLYTNYYSVMYGVDARARTNTNSWGYTTGQGNYNADSRDSDLFISDNPDMIILYAAGNEGVDGNPSVPNDSDGVVDPGSTNMPGTAKNVITVGASENLRLTGGYNPGGPCDAWGDCWPSDYPVAPLLADPLSNNVNGMVAFSSRGPVNDGRLKPDIVAPGSNIVSTRDDSGTGWGVFDANYIYNGGTSMATPLAAGAAAVVREFYQDEQDVASPTAALVKATLINGAFDMFPGQYGDNAQRDVTRRPDINQGWGRVDLRNSLVYEGQRALWFHEASPGLETAQQFETTLDVLTSTVPLRVSLVWSDEAGTEASFGALVNDLDLVVEGPGGVVLHGNDNLGDGTLDLDVDRTNNLEGVDVAAPTVGEWTVTVTGFNVPSGPQPFALVVTGGLPKPGFSINADPNNLEICAGSTAEFDVDVLQDLPTFTDPVTLSASGNPAGTTVSFVPNGNVPPYSSVFSVGNTAAVAGGSYPMLISGTDGVDTDETQVILNVVGAEPGAFDLLAPADAAVDVLLRPQLSWEASPEAESYLVEVATDPAFTTIVFSQTVGATNVTVANALAQTTVHYWRVTANNICGDTAASAVHSFTTREAPRILLVDDDNNAPDVRPLYTAAMDAVTGPGSYDVVATSVDGEPDAGELSAYDKVIWFSGDQFGSGSATNPLAGPTAASETALATWLDTGRCLFLSSQDYFYDRDEVITPFMTSHLGVDTMENDVDNQYTAVAGENAYAGLGGALTFAANFSNYTDYVTPDAAEGGERSFRGSAGAGNNQGAGVSKEADYFTTFLAFPLENLPAASMQQALQRFDDTCGDVLTPPAVEAVADDYDGSEDTTLTVNAANGVLDNDTTVGVDPLTAALVDDTNTGTLTLNADGSFTFVPDANVCGVETFTYTATDGTATSEAATVTLDIACVNDAPVAVDDAYTGAEGVTLSVTPAQGVLVNDSDAENSSLTAAIVTQPSNGVALLATNGSFTYLPGTGFCGEDSFTYRASDGSVNSAPATVDITVECDNEAPVAGDLPDVMVVYGQAANINGAQGYTDPDGDPMNYSATGLPASLAINPTTGVITGTPLQAEVGTYTVTVTAEDPDDASASDSFTLTVVGLPVFANGFE